MFTLVKYGAAIIMLWLLAALILAGAGTFAEQVLHLYQ